MRVVAPFRYFGSISFAILLIVLAAFGVMLGTVIEAKTGSHQMASRWVYSNPLFLLVLWGFFVNILMATLNRAPFCKDHLPFIITHIGLLMVISGTLLKYSFGLQGTVTLKEGTSSRWVVLDHTQALSLQKRGSDTWHQIPLEKSVWGTLKTHYEHDHLSLDIRGWSPHGEEKIHSWIKGDHLSFLHMPPIPLGRSTPLRGYSTIGLKAPEDIQNAPASLPALIFFEDKAIEITADGIREPTSYLYAYDGGRAGYTTAIRVGQEEFETPLEREFIPLPLPKKAEEERPLLALSFGQEKIALAFNSSLPTPALNGEYLLRFEPMRAPLPEPLHLRSAQTLFYPNSREPQSYTAHLRVGKEKPTLSMNQVWESEAGFRFYLANLSPLDESDVKHVRLVVNRDPFKRWLTYPGALILSLGIILLLSRKP